eukprot:1139146-Pelagomonas_calceolata.AAC.6
MPGLTTALQLTATLLSVWRASAITPTPATPAHKFALISWQERLLPTLPCLSLEVRQLHHHSTTPTHTWYSEDHLLFDRPPAPPSQHYPHPHMVLRESPAL